MLDPHLEGSRLVEEAPRASSRPAGAFRKPNLKLRPLAAEPLHVVVAERLGHQDANVTAKVYSHVTPKPAALVEAPDVCQPSPVLFGLYEKVGN